MITKDDPRVKAALDALRQLGLPPFPDGSTVTTEDAQEVVEAVLGADPEVETQTQYGIRWDGSDAPTGVQWVTMDPDSPYHRDALKDPDLAKHLPVKVRRTVTTTDWEKVS